MLYAIAYISRSLVQDDIALTLAGIGRRSASRNLADGITGAIVCSTSNFAQIIEGGRTQIDALISRISADPRHEDMQILFDRPIEQRSFEGWGMAVAGIVNENVLKKIQSTFERTSLKPPTANQAEGYHAWIMLSLLLQRRVLESGGT